MHSAELDAFLATPDDAMAAYGRARAKSVGLTVPVAVEAGVFDNLALLRDQAARVAAALTGAEDGPLALFQP